MKLPMRWKGWRAVVGIILLGASQWIFATVPEVSDPAGFTLAVDRFGAVYAWGNNGSGQLGDGTTNPSLVPEVVSSLSGIVSVAGGGVAPQGFSFAVRSDGVAFAWGYNADGELGLGNTSTGPMVPTQIPSFANVLTVSAGKQFAVALKKDGTVWAWGANDHGQLGKGDNFPSSSPLQVPGLANMVKVVAGGTHVLALRADGAVFAWGYNLYGQVGNNSPIDSLVPVQVGLPGAAIDIAASSIESWAALADGSVYGWGDNAVGQVGDLTRVITRPTPVRARGFLPRTVKLARANPLGQAAQAHALDGRLWKWGWGDYGQMGDGYQTTANPMPQMLSGLGNQGVMASSSGLQSHHVRTGGTVAGWGANSFGPGETGTANASPPTVVSTPVVVLGVGGAGFLNLGNFDGRKSNFSGANNDGWLLWRLPSLGANTLWRLNGNSVTVNQAITAVGTTWHVAGTGDLNGDGRADIVWVEAGGAIVVWEMNGTTITSSAVVGTVPAGWSLVAVGDVNGDGKDDLVFRSAGGVVAAWIMDGFSVRNVEVIGSMATNYQLAWVADFDGNGIKDFLWFDPATGSAIIWELFATAPINVWNLGTLGPGWTPALVGDFDGDGRADILWRNGATNVIWYMNAGVAKTTQLMPTVDVSWTPVAVMDATGFGQDDIIWLNTGGTVVRWQMQGIGQAPVVAVIAVQGVGWQVVGQH